MTHDCESHNVWLLHMTYNYKSWVSRMWSISVTWLVLWVMIGLGMLRSWLIRVIWWISHYDSFESWVAWRGSMSHGWGKNPYIRAPSGQEFGFFTQPSKLLSLLLVQSTIFILVSTSEGQSVLRDNDPPYTILIRVLVSQYKREAVVIRIKGYLLQVLPYESPNVTRVQETKWWADQRDIPV